MKILGIDPGLAVTGYGLIEGHAKSRVASGADIKLVEAGVIRTSAKAGIVARLLKIYDGLSEIIEEHRPDALVLEKIYSHYKHPATAILMGHARGVVCLLCGRYNLPLVNYAPTHVKKAIVGKGRAAKKQVGGMIKTLLSLKSAPKPEDITDALAVAVSHFHTLIRLRKIPSL